MATLKKFLSVNDACAEGYLFAKDLTLEEFLTTCERGDWILWLFKHTNPDSIEELTLAKAHCANTVRHLMKDKRSLNAVDTAFAFGEGKATREELDAAASDAASADASAAATAAAFAANAALASASASAASAAADAAFAAAFAAANASADADAAFDTYVDAKKDQQKQAADICRQHLPVAIWNQKEI